MTDTSTAAVTRLNTHRVYIDRTMCFDEGITWTTVAGLYPHAYVPEDFALALLARAEAAEADARQWAVDLEEFRLERDAALAEVARLSHALAALRREREPVKVKPLVWFPAPSICTREKAEAMGGHYSVVEFDAGTDEHHFAANIDLGGLAFVFILEPDPLGGRRPKRYPTLEAAKAAAQADHEARILAALEPDQAALAAIERAAYERGVKEAAARVSDICLHADVPGGNCTPDTFDEGVSAAFEFVLALIEKEPTNDR